jgi:hypothetical protein
MTKFTAADERSLINILLRYWEEITEIEEKHALLVGKGDVRPRIEFFHDAIRAYTSGNGNAHPRLTVEKLSYDLKLLRYVAATPMASLTQDEHGLSPSTGVVASGPGLVQSARKLDRDAKIRLKELYEQYGVLFASLLKITAENDQIDRSEQLNSEVEEINRLINAIEKNATMQQITLLIQNLSDEALKRDLLLLVPQLQGKSAGAMHGLIARLRSKTQKNDAKIAGMDKAMHEYSTSQLALYENARDMLKSMAGKGMNLVGAFVESALKGGQKGRGR